MRATPVEAARGEVVLIVYRDPAQDDRKREAEEEERPREQRKSKNWPAFEGGESRRRNRPADEVYEHAQRLELVAAGVSVRSWRRERIRYEAGHSRVALNAQPGSTRTRDRNPVQGSPLADVGAAQGQREMSRARRSAQLLV